MTAPSLTVLLVNWNGAEFLPPCLRSVAAQSYPGELRVMVVDNGSTDDSLALLARDFPDVDVLRNPVNNYAGANNLGVREAGTELVCLLNTDAELEPGCLQRLVDRLLSDAKIAAAAPKILYPDGRLYTTGAHERDDLYWVDRDQGDPDDGRRDEVEDVFGVSGCCAVHRVAAWQAVGGLDEDFHMYYEDVEFSLRLRRAGWRLVYEPAARVEHVGGGSIAKTEDGKDPIGERNRLLVLARHYPERAAVETARSRWLQLVDEDQLRAFLPVLVRHYEGVDPLRFLSDVLVAWRAECAYPQVVRDRDGWIVKLLEEVRRLRVYRLPWKRLKPIEADFLRRHGRD